jgi:hypothetical protein
MIFRTFNFKIFNSAKFASIKSLMQTPIMKNIYNGFKSQITFSNFLNDKDVDQ